MLQRSGRYVAPLLQAACGREVSLCLEGELKIEVRRLSPEPCRADPPPMEPDG